MTKTTKTIKKKNKLNKFVEKFNILFQLIKDVLAWVKTVLAKKSVQIGIAILLAVMFMLGFSINWQCGSGGWECGGGYVPPNPDDVNKILKVGKISGSVKK